MRAAHYAHALEQLLKEHPESETELIERLVVVVRDNGHHHLLSKILRSFTKLHERDEKRNTIEVITATAVGETDIQRLLKSDPFKRILSTKHKHVKRTIDDSIVGGTIVRTGSQRVDASFKRALIELYQNITK